MHCCGVKVVPVVLNVVFHGVYIMIDAYSKNTKWCSFNTTVFYSVLPWMAIVLNPFNNYKILNLQNASSVNFET